MIQPPRSGSNAISSGIMPVVELTLEEYDSLKRKEFVFDIEKAKLESKVKESSWFDEDRRILYGIPTKEEMNAEELAKALAKTIERLEKEGEV